MTTMASSRAVRSASAPGGCSATFHSGCGNNADGSLEPPPICLDAVLAWRHLHDPVEPSLLFKVDLAGSVAQHQVQASPATNFDGQWAATTSKVKVRDDILDTATFSQTSIDLRGKIPQIHLTPGF
jgi:hypothetical protein